MEVGELIAALRADGERLASAAERADLAARVPTCPEWSVRDLVRHTGGVHRWATSIVSAPRTELWDVGLDKVAGTWPEDPDLVGWFRDGHKKLVAALEAADPDLWCWTFLRASSPRLMWARRQAHETAIHRVDAELAAGTSAPTPFDPRFAADGIDELVSCFITRPRGRLRADPPRTLRVRTTDARGDWHLHIGPNRVVTRAGHQEAAECEVSGPASDLYQALWNRRGIDGLTVSGDPEVLTLFLDRVHIRWT